MNKTYYTPSKHLRLLHLKIFPLTPKSLPLPICGVEKLSGFPRGKAREFCPYPTKRGKGKLSSKVPWDRHVRFQDFPGRFSRKGDGQRSITKSYLVHISVTILHQIHILRPIYAEIFGIKTSHGSTFESQAFASQASEKNRSYPM